MYAMWLSVLPYQALEVHFLEASVCAVTVVTQTNQKYFCFSNSQFTFLSCQNSLPF